MVTNSGDEIHHKEMKSTKRCSLAADVQVNFHLLVLVSFMFPLLITVSSSLKSQDVLGIVDHDSIS